MSKDDRYGIAGAVFCAGMAWYDEWWRPFWATAAVVLAVWTIVSVAKRSRS